MMKYKFSNILLLSIIFFLASCQEKPKETEKEVESTKETVASNNDQVFGVGRIEPEAGLTNLVAGTSGKILKVLIEENQIVNQNQALIIVDQTTENIQLVQAKSKLTPQRASVATQQANIESIKTKLQNAKSVYERNTALYKGNAGTKQAMDDSRFEVNNWEKELDFAQVKLNEINSKVTELNADIKFYESIITQKKVNAPSKGKILKVIAKQGEYAQNEMVIAEFAPDGILVAKTEIDEIYADRIAIGQKAFLLSQTSGDTIANGSVYFAADYLKAKSLFKDQSTELEDRRIREVHIKIEDGKKPLIGSRVDCIILLK